MRAVHLSLVAMSLLFLAVPCARAQDTLETESGNTYQGKVISNDGTAVEITTTDGATMRIPYAQLTPQTQYRLKLPQAGDDGTKILELADWCVDKRLYKEARTEYRRALKVAPTMEEEINKQFTAARTTAANELLARGKRLQSEKKPVEAREVLSVLVRELPLEPASKEATQLLAAETTQRKQDALSRAPAPAPDAADGADVPPRASGEPFSDATKQLFHSVIDSYHQMLDNTQQGLEKGGSNGISEFEKAIKEGDKIRSTLDGLRPKGANDAEITEALQLADSKVEEAIVDARLDLADAYMLRTSYNQAAEAVRKGLAQYPQNERLRLAMNRVTAASSDDDYGWVLRR
jgi:hypothetical protein